jgi:hypothetical protein
MPKGSTIDELQTGNNAEARHAFEGSMRQLETMKAKIEEKGRKNMQENARKCTKNCEKKEKSPAGQLLTRGTAAGLPRAVHEP